MQLNPASTLIRPVECRNANNHSETGICMFSIDCMQNKGTPLSICKHNYFVGTCCKLPDHNNFVGIVYDLRETETAAQAALAAAQLSGRLDPSSAQKQQEKPINQQSSSMEVGDQHQPQQATAQSFSVHTQPSPSTQDDIFNDSNSPMLTTGTLDSEKIAPPSAAPLIGLASNFKQEPSTTSSAESSSMEDKLLEEKYMISSTSLFSSQQQPSSTSKRPVLQIDSNNVGSISQESARNADGSVGVPAMQTEQPQSTTSSVLIETNANKNNATAIAYDLIREELAEIQQQQQQQQSSQVLSSAHSPPGASQVYSMNDDSQQQKATIVFANNHGPVSSWNTNAEVPMQSDATKASDSASTVSSTVAQSSSVAHDIPLTFATQSSQEFISSPAAVSSDLSDTSNMTTTAVPTTKVEPTKMIQTTTASSVTDSTSVSTEHPIASSSSSQQISSSPFYDLISSSPTMNNSQPTKSNQHHEDLAPQTTTPFTSSLSTALLPNISSHPFSPTTPIPVSTHSLSSSIGPNESSSSSTTLVSQQQQQTSSMVDKQQQQQQGSGPITRAPILFASTEHQVSNKLQPTHNAQLYSNQHASKPASVLIFPPSASLQAASKIVSGSSASSSMPSNNLIPGLSGLQSAILSHIPFKIASGLSSGLSSYLQAAMKPAGSSGAGRPLISSNTAPALQYQQHQSASNGTRAPTTSSPSSAPTSTSGHASHLSTTLSSLKFANFSSTEGQPQQSPSNALMHPTRDILREAQQVCGRPQVTPTSDFIRKRVGRIVGGNQSLFGQWPWMVSLRQWRKGAFLHKCGAALLNENWAITAAHCVEKLGEFDVSNQNEPFPYIERRVKTVVAHQLFDPKTFEYDLALLKFAEPIQFERNIIPVCVPGGNDSYVDRIATVIGWGRLYEDGPLPDVIQHVDVPIIANDECEKMYKNAGYVEEIPEMFICAGINKGGRDSCEGDSGGPLTMVDYDGRSYLVGIISWGIGCALPSQPGVYTRITAFSDWINQVIAAT